MSKSADELQRAKWLSLLRIVLVYAGFASLWILLSDEAVLLVTTEPHRMVQISQYKGWAFVLITSLLLLWLLTRHWKNTRRAARADQDAATAAGPGQQLERRDLCQDLQAATCSSTAPPVTSSARDWTRCSAGTIAR